MKKIVLFLALVATAMCASAQATNLPAPFVREYSHAFMTKDDGETSTRYNESGFFIFYADGKDCVVHSWHDGDRETLMFQGEVVDGNHPDYGGFQAKSAITVHHNTETDDYYPVEIVVILYDNGIVRLSMADGVWIDFCPPNRQI